MKKDAIDRLAALFRGSDGAHGTHGTPEKDPDGLKWNIKRTAKTLRGGATPEMWRKHVKGERPLGVIPIGTNNLCSWGSIDFDEYDVDLMELVDKVEASKLPLVPCISKSGGLHLFLFLREPEPAADMQNLLREAAASLGMAECEIFPKQTQILTERNDAGNWMVMPYYGGDFGGKLKMQRGVKKTGAEMTIDEFVSFAEKKQTTILEFASLCEARKAPAKKHLNGASGKGKKRDKSDKDQAREDFSNGPPCLQHIRAAGPQKDGRKRTLFMHAVYLKRADPSGWKEKLELYNQANFSPPLPASEMNIVLTSVGKKDYEYTCKIEPMKSHCDSALCRFRKFGVGRGGEYPVISGLTKLLTEPPIWFVDVESTRLELTTEELGNYLKFHNACMSRVDKCYRMMKQDQWFSMVAEAMANMDTLEAPSDLSTPGIFHEQLEEFLTNRARGTRKEDLWNDRPWECVEEGRHYFSLKALMKFLTQENVKDVKRPQLSSKIRALGGGHKFFNDGNVRGLQCWWVPSSAVTAPPQIAPPKVEENDL